MISAQCISEIISKKTRTLVLGGMAVIIHGLNRSTKDLDIWTDPKQWATAIEDVLQSHSQITAVYLDDTTCKWEPASKGQIAQISAKGRVLRLLGCDRPLDIFYKPNEVELEEFDKFWDRGIKLDDGSRVLDAVDLIITKQLTDRPHDRTDIAFLESKIEKLLFERLPVESYEYAAAQFARFRSADTAYIATTNSDPKVKGLGLNILCELAQEGDPFAKEHLETIRLNDVEGARKELRNSTHSPEIGDH